MLNEFWQVLAGYGPWGVLFLVAVLFRPARTLSRIVSAEITRHYENYLRRRSVSETEIKRLLADKQNDSPADDDDKPPSTAA